MGHPDRRALRVISVDVEPEERGRGSAEYALGAMETQVSLSDRVHNCPDMVPVVFRGPGEYQDIIDEHDVAFARLRVAYRLPRGPLPLGAASTPAAREQDRVALPRRCVRARPSSSIVAVESVTTEWLFGE